MKPKKPKKTSKRTAPTKKTHKKTTPTHNKKRRSKSLVARMSSEETTRPQSLPPSTEEGGNVSSATVIEVKPGTTIHPTNK